MPGRVRCYGPTFDGGVLSMAATDVTVGVGHACWFEPTGVLVGRFRCLGSTIARGPFDGGETTSGLLLRPAGDDFTCMVDGALGGLSCWGRNDQWQLGADGGGLSSPEVPPAAALTAAATAVGWNHACRIFVPATGPNPTSLVCWGDDSNGKLGLPPGAGPRLPTLIQP
ncbi:MAG: hypothetical protein GQE15_30030 [Archangiaceae bacterium]|nr:hypothetical protein [Archangiaceae bacterium]